MTLVIRPTAQTTIPVEVEGLTPDRMREKSLDEIREFDIYHGNEKLPLGEMFQVEGDASDMRWELHGDFSGVHWIGAHMEIGSIRVCGMAGRHLGSEMRGGEIHVEGNAGDWVGGEMHGGTIHVRGRAGHLIGAAYRGSRVGMTGGTILIEGEAGNEVGHTMRRGLIAVGSHCADMIGFNMLAGTILVFGNAGIRPGAGMRRGTIGLFGTEPPPLLPTFRRACRYEAPILRLLARQLRTSQFPVGENCEAPVDVFNGDLLDGGRGEILIPADDS